MSEPWMHPEREATGSTGEVPVTSPDSGLAGQPAAQDGQPVQRQSVQQMPALQQPVQQQPEPVMQQTQQLPQQQYVPPAEPVRKKKSGMLGLLGLLFVLGGIVAALVSIGIGLGGIEFSENFFQSLGKFQTASALVFALGFFLWFLGSVLCLIGVAARRGVVAGVIGLFLVVVPSWAVGLSMVALAFGSTALLGGLF